MKTLLTTTALALAIGAAAAAETKIDTVTGCTIRPIQNSNAYQFDDPHCPKAWAVRTGNEGSPESDFPPVEEDEDEDDGEGEGKSH